MSEEEDELNHAVLICLYLIVVFIAVLITLWFIDNNFAKIDNILLSSVVIYGLFCLPCILVFVLIGIKTSDVSSMDGETMNIEPPRSNLGIPSAPDSTSLHSSLPLLPSFHPPTILLDDLEAFIQTAQPLEQGPLLHLELFDDSDLPPKYECPPKYDECA